MPQLISATKNCSFVLYLILISLQLHTQEINGSEEILKIMEKSKLMYTISSLKQPIAEPDRSNLINNNYNYRTVYVRNINVKQYQPQSEALSLFNEAKKIASENKHEEAIKIFTAAYGKDSSFHICLTETGNSYFKLNDYSNAIIWYNKSIQKNFIDYEAHMMLAKCLEKTGEPFHAMKEVTIASILNRNHPEVLNTMVLIFKANGKEFVNWHLTPQVKIDSVNEKNITVGYSGSKWIGYAMAEAVWLYEPGYAASKGYKKNEPSVIRAKECLISTLSSLKSPSKKKEPGLYYLKNALDNKYIDEYIYYEMLLTDHPELGLTLSLQFIIDIQNYVLNIRCNDK